jgi:YVTN family beta-propeller protein
MSGGREGPGAHRRPGRAAAFGGLVVVLVALAAIVASQRGPLDADAGHPSRAATPSPVRTVASGPIATAVPTDHPVASKPESPGTARAGVYADITRDVLDPRVAGIRPLVYVPNNDSNTVSVIDPRSFRVIRTFPVGSGPQHVSPSWNMRRLYVGNTYANTLTEIDPGSGRPTRTISVPDPYNLYFTPDGSTAIDVAERLQTLYFLDPSTWHQRAALHVPFAGIDHLDFSADGSYLVLSAEFSGEVVKIDVARKRIVGSLHVGGSPVDVKVSPDGSLFYVANQTRNGISVIDPNTMTEIAFVPTGAGAHGFCVSRDARALYVSNRLAGSISVLSFRTQKVVRTWHVGGSPDMMQVSADGRLLWVSNRYDGTVSVISTRTGRVLHTITVGASPHGLTLYPQPGRFSIGHNGVYR